MARPKRTEEKKETAFFSFEMEKEFAEKFESAVKEMNTTKRTYTLMALQAFMDGKNLVSENAASCQINNDEIKEVSANLTEQKKMVDTLTMKIFSLDSKIERLEQEIYNLKKGL